MLVKISPLYICGSADEELCKICRHVATNIPIEDTVMDTFSSPNSLELVMDTVGLARLIRPLCPDKSTDQ